MPPGAVGVAGCGRFAGTSDELEWLDDSFDENHRDAPFALRERKEPTHATCPAQALD
jgi:hypothetical protein